MENYEQKYKDALERASKLIGQNPFDTVGQMVEHIFPELLESKDEGIRKTLIAFFRDWERTKSHCWNVNVSDIIAWLEKQGENKKLDADKVVKWLDKQACLGWLEDIEVEKVVEQFKKDFGL